MAEVKPTKHPTNFKDLTGLAFGRLTVLSYAGTVARWQTEWLCRCVCGNEITARAGNLRSGNTKSCGCWNNLVRSEVHTSHGNTKNRVPTRAYRSWQSAKKRCLNSWAHNYKFYGGRGITMCQRWIDSFDAFYADMGERPPGTTLDRINNEGNYEPGNCRWATHKVQMENRRKRAKKEKPASHPG